MPTVALHRPGERGIATCPALAKHQIENERYCTDYVHGKGLQLGCYTSPATKNCCGEPVGASPPHPRPGPSPLWAR
eukprot:gene5169-5247_t